MDLDQYEPPVVKPGTIESTELFVDDDVLVKLFALGPSAELSTHEHPDSTNVFHVLEGTVTVIQDGTAERIDAPGVVFHERGVSHGARNDTADVAVLTASLCPLPGSG